MVLSNSSTPLRRVWGLRKVIFLRYDIHVGIATTFLFLVTGAWQMTDQKDLMPEFPLYLPPL